MSINLSNLGARVLRNLHLLDTYWSWSKKSDEIEAYEQGFLERWADTLKTFIGVFAEQTRLSKMNVVLIVLAQAVASNNKIGIIACIQFIRQLDNRRKLGLLKTEVQTALDLDDAETVLLAFQRMRMEQYQQMAGP